MEKNVVNVGVVGYGYAGRMFHAYLVNLTEGLKVYAVASRQASRRQQAERDYGARTYQTIDQLLDDDNVDLVVIATPHDTHADMAIRAMKAGKHVVVDKPIALTVAQADAMLATQKETGKLLSVFFNRRWDNDFLTLKKVIQAGWLGEPYLFEASITRYAPPGGWRRERANMGSLLHDWGVHLIDQALQLVPSKPTAVFCHTNFRHWKLSVESFVKVTVLFDGGVSYTIEVNYLSRATKPRWHVVGELGAFTKFGLDPQEAALQRGDIRQAREDNQNRARVWTVVDGVEAEVTVESVPGDWRSYYRNIAGVLLQGEELAVKPIEARNGLAVIEAALKSAQTHQVVSLG